MLIYVNQPNFAERIDSLKAGILGAFCAAIAHSLLVVVHTLLLSTPTISWLSADGLWVIHTAIALCSGFLFAVTYRYVVRQDTNPHLRSGAVLAFGLVRGLAQIEGTIDRPIDWSWLGLPLVESVLLFAIIRWAIDGAIGRGWIQHTP